MHRLYICYHHEENFFALRLAHRLDKLLEGAGFFCVDELFGVEYAEDFFHRRDHLAFNEKSALFSSQDRRHLLQTRLRLQSYSAQIFKHQPDRLDRKPWRPHEILKEKSAVCILHVETDLMPRIMINVSLELVRLRKHAVGLHKVIEFPRELEISRREIIVENVLVKAFAFGIVGEEIDPVGENVFDGGMH